MHAHYTYSFAQGSAEPRGSHVSSLHMHITIFLFLSRARMDLMDLKVSVVPQDHLDKMDPQVQLDPKDQEERVYVIRTHVAYNSR